MCPSFAIFGERLEDDNEYKPQGSQQECVIYRNAQMLSLKHL